MIYERRVGSRATASLRVPSPPLTEFPTIGANRSAFTTTGVLMGDEYQPTRTCAVCNADISHRWRSTLYCSNKCTDEAAIVRGTKTRGRKKRETVTEKGEQQ